MIAEKIKSLIAYKGYSNKYLAEQLGISTQQLSNKFRLNTFTAEDLIRIADICGVDLSFSNKDFQVLLTCDDLRQ